MSAAPNGPVGRFAVLTGGKAVLKPPHSKRFAKFGDIRQSRQRLDCGGFSTAFGSARRPGAHPLAWFAFLLSATVPFLCAFAASAAAADNAFASGVAAYRTADFARAAQLFRESAAARPAAGTLQNLGNAEWQRRRAGDAILAWEQALWVNPFDAKARNNLKYARETAQLEAPELTWSEEASRWLPPNWWAWISGVSLWLAVGMLTLPGILRRRKAPWQQAVAALGLGVFLLSLPAQYGTFTRSKIGIVLQKDTPLRLTPTAEGEAITRLAAGEPARKIRTRGNYVFIRTNRASGWVEQEQFGLICSR